MKRNELDAIERDVEKKNEKMERRRLATMKVSGSSVKKLAQIIKRRAS